MAETTDESTELKVKIFSPTEVYFYGPALSVSASNDTGNFDILPQHHNFITLLNEGKIDIRQPNGENSVVEISGGVMHVKQNSVVVFLGV